MLSASYPYLYYLIKSKMKEEQFSVDYNKKQAVLSLQMIE